MFTIQKLIYIVGADLCVCPNKMPFFIGRTHRFAPTLCVKYGCLLLGTCFKGSRTLQECCDSAEESLRHRIASKYAASPDRTVRLCAIGVAMHRYLSRETPGGYSAVGDLAVVRMPGRNQMVEEALMPYLDISAGIG